MKTDAAPAFSFFEMKKRWRVCARHRDQVLFVERDLELEARSELHLEHRAGIVSEQQLANSR